MDLYSFRETVTFTGVLSTLLNSSLKMVLTEMKQKESWEISVLILSHAVALLSEKNSEYTIQKLTGSIEQQGAWQQSRAHLGGQEQHAGPIKMHFCALAEIIRSNIAVSETLQHSEPA